MTKKITKTAKFVVDATVEFNGRDGNTYGFKCPKCKKFIELATWQSEKCDCGLEWRISMFVKAMGR